MTTNELENHQPWHPLTSEECDYTEQVLKEMEAASSIVRIGRLLTAITNQGGPRKIENRPLLFEARVCHEVSRAGVKAEYEYRAGEGSSGIDLRILGEPEHLIEIVSMDESDALQLATHEEGLMLGGEARSLMLSSDASDQRLTDAGEMIQLQQKLCAKVFDKDKPHKFPEPKDGVYHAILADVRGFCGGCRPDKDHIRQIMYGPKHVSNRAYVQSFEGKDVFGIFDSRNKRPAARLMRERIHLIGFCFEREFKPGWIKEYCTWAGNPFLPASKQAYEYLPSCLRAG